MHVTASTAGNRRWAGRMLVAGVTAVLAIILAAQSQAASSTSPQGQWSPVYRWPNISVHLHLLPNGKLLSWEGGNEANAYAAGSAKAHVVNIPDGGEPSNVWVTVTNSNTNIFCSGHTFLPDGRLLVTGGRSIPSYGVPDLNIFDYRVQGPQSPWQTIGGLPPSYARWYGSAVGLASGDVLLLTGNRNGFSDPNTLPQVWHAADGSFRDLTSAVLKLHNYSMTFLAPDGRVFQAGPEKRTHFLDTSGAGAWYDGPSHQSAVRASGTAVMYGDGKVLVIGGGRDGQVPTNTAEIVDLNSPTPAWQYTSSMLNARRHANATLLPDGKVLVTGGSNSTSNNTAAGAILPAEMWDPATGAWSIMASLTNPRIYHSTAVLLPDGRVLTAGGSKPTGLSFGLNNAQIYSPPYLFQGTRPVIAAAPASIGYGTTFNVATADAASIAKVRLVKLSSVTHSFNMGQRIATLNFNRTTDNQGLVVDLPADRNLVPPGHYMLFILSSDDVPSVARILQVGDIAQLSVYDGLEYIASYGDLIRAFGANAAAGIQHYQLSGQAEGRILDRFNVRQYLAKYPDLEAAFGTNYLAAITHFITNGYYEGRSDLAP
jgi:hypothetical protein